GRGSHDSLGWHPELLHTAQLSFEGFERDQLLADHQLALDALLLGRSGCIRNRCRPNLHRRRQPGGHLAHPPLDVDPAGHQSRTPITHQRTGVASLFSTSRTYRPSLVTITRSPVPAPNASITSTGSPSGERPSAAIICTTSNFWPFIDGCFTV